MNEKSELKERTLNGALWKFAEKVGMQIMQFVIQIVLARLLLPEDYGTVGLVTIFISILDIFALQGLTTALIQKREADEKDYSTVFYMNIIGALVLYAVCYLIAPFVANFYNDDLLVDIMRVLTLTVFFGAIGAVPNAILSKRLDFKKTFLRGISNIAVQGIVGVWMAYQGFGVWALVYSKLAGIMTGTIVIWGAVKWRPKLLFSATRVKMLFSYSSKVLGVSLLNTIFSNIHSLVIGKFFTKADLGYYQRGQQIPHTFMNAVDGSISEVLYPAFSLLQGTTDELKDALRRSIKQSMFIVLPSLLGLIATADTVVRILLTEKWLPSVPFIKLSCVICAFWPLAAKTVALNAMGKSSITLKLSLISKGITIVFIFLCIKSGIYAIMLGTICASVISALITAGYTKKELGYSLLEQIRDIGPAVLLASGMCFTVNLFNYSDLNIYMMLLVQMVSGIIIYVGGAYFLKLDEFIYLMKVIKKKVSVKRIDLEE